MSDFNVFKAHFPAEISKSLANFAINVALKESRYIFTYITGKQQFGYCTHCKNDYKTLGLKHKSSAVCPSCKSKCKVQSSGMSRKYLYDHTVFIWYEKSKIDPQAITARVLSMARDYSGDYRKIETGYNCCHMLLFEPGNSEYYFLGYGGWSKRTSVFSPFDNFFSGQSYWKKFMSLSNIRRVVKGTPFQYSTWEQYTKYKNPSYVSDMVEFFDLAARYPCIEYLTKVGMNEAIWAKLYHNPTYGAIHWQGKTLEKVLRLSKTEIKELRQSNLLFGPRQLRYYQKAKKSGIKISLPDAFILSDVDDSFYKDYFIEILQLAPADKVLKYMLKQMRTDRYKSVKDLLSDWRDYQRQCKQLGMSLKQERYLFPNNLHEAHRKLTSRIKIKSDKKINQKIADRLPELENLRFEYKGLFLRPAASSIELFYEGKEQDHCIGGYSRGYANGEFNVFFIRRISNPDKSFYTLQVRGSTVVQCRGFDNCDMIPEVKSFVDKFIATKLLTKKKTRVDVTNLNNNQGVAI